MPNDTDRLALPYILADQAQKHVSHNEALVRLDAVVQLSVLGRDLTDPPASPENGARYIVAEGAAGAWTGRQDTIAVWQDGAWMYLTPQAGWRCWNQTQSELLVYGDEGWDRMGLNASDLEEGAIDVLGVNTAADSFNRLAAKTSAVLISHDDVSGSGNGSVLGTFNKNAPGNDAGFNFQTGWSTRALMGLYGDDDFRIKVSADGSSFHDALVVARGSGVVRFPNGGAREQLTANSTYYVRIDGDDGNDGRTDSAGGAFRTIQHAVDMVSNLDPAIYTVTISVAAGSYDEAVSMSVATPGAFKIVGDNASPANVETRGFSCSHGARWSVSGFRLTSGNGIKSESRGDISFDHIHFAGSGNAISVNNALAYCQYADLHFGAGVTAICVAYNYGFLSMFGATLDLAPGITWNAGGAFYLSLLSTAWIQGVTWTGSSASGRRYQIGFNSVLATGNAGATFIPGTASGTAVSGAQYG